MKIKLPKTILRSSRKFKKSRADYYEYLADVIEGSEGAIKFQQLFERDAVRYAGLPRGILAEHWKNTFAENGADLSITWQGQFPDAELALIAVAQQSGGGAVITTLRDLAVNARLQQAIAKKTVTATLIAGVGVLVALVMGLVYPVIVAPLMLKTFSMVPEEFWRPVARNWFAYAATMKSILPLILIAIVIAVMSLKWSINNLTGSFRDRLDRSNFFFSTLRDIRAISFLTTLETISKRRGQSTMTLKNALEMFQASSNSPWFKWRINEIVARIETSGAVSSEVFKTNIISDEVFYYLRDMQEARGFTEGFHQTAAYVKVKLLEKINLKLTIYQYTLLFIAGVAVFAVTATQLSVIRSMTDSMKAFYSSR